MRFEVHKDTTDLDSVSAPEGRNGWSPKPRPDLFLRWDGHRLVGENHLGPFGPRSGVPADRRDFPTETRSPDLLYLHSIC